MTNELPEYMKQVNDDYMSLLLVYACNRHDPVPMLAKKIRRFAKVAQLRNPKSKAFCQRLRTIRKISTDVLVCATLKVAMYKHFGDDRYDDFYGTPYNER